jgi:hypothetical protein
MHIIHRGLQLCCLALLLVGAAAVGGLNGVDVTIANDGTEDVVVTLYDTSSQPNGQPNAVVFARERINGFTKIPVSLAADESGRANLAWTAVTVGPQSRKCGHATQAGLADAALVSVHADSECGAP